MSFKELAFLVSTVCVRNACTGCWSTTFLLDYVAPRPNGIWALGASTFCSWHSPTKAARGDWNCCVRSFIPDAIGPVASSTDLLRWQRGMLALLRLMSGTVCQMSGTVCRRGLNDGCRFFQGGNSFSLGIPTGRNTWHCQLYASPLDHPLRLCSDSSDHQVSDGKALKREAMVYETIRARRKESNFTVTATWTSGVQSVGNQAVPGAFNDSHPQTRS
ncbi:uncharacterized protein J3D65DRAFT_452263 [Phyllosticta citribraziliensis]|uniref:Secreted protein n=1 Tax=Phyllosticta citribraziliensis TaxID=989973 RepID=A0ABR1LJN5_9PEZI